MHLKLRKTTVALRDNERDTVSVSLLLIVCSTTLTLDAMTAVAAWWGGPNRDARMQNLWQPGTTKTCCLY